MKDIDNSEPQQCDQEKNGPESTNLANQEDEENKVNANNYIREEKISDTQILKEASPPELPQRINIEELRQQIGRNIDNEN